MIPPASAAPRSASHRRVGTRILKPIARCRRAEESRHMGRITIDMTINASVDTVFAYVDDYRNTTRYMRDLVKWHPTGKVTHGKGAQFEVGMKAGPTTLTSVVAITTWTENKAIGWHSHEGFKQIGM